MLADRLLEGSAARWTVPNARYPKVHWRVDGFIRVLVEGRMRDVALLSAAFGPHGPGVNVRALVEDCVVVASDEELRRRAEGMP